MAYDLCAGVDPVSRKYMQSEMRNYLYNCIGTKWLKPFGATIETSQTEILSVKELIWSGSDLFLKNADMFMEA